MISQTKILTWILFEPTYLDQAVYVDIKLVMWYKHTKLQLFGDSIGEAFQKIIIGFTVLE